MNPFDLPGPQFLLLYALLGAVVTLAMRWMRRQQEAAYSVPQRLDDPHLFAMLRGGEDEALRVALMSLLDRKLLAVDGEGRLALREGTDTSHAQREIETALLGVLREPHTVDAVLAGLRHHPAIARYKERLSSMGLLPDAQTKSNRFRIWLMGFGFLAITAVVKIGIGLSRNRPVAFLVAEVLIFAFITAAVCFPRRTAGGDALVRNMKELFSSLKTRAASIRAGGETSELMWLGAVFGLAAVPSILFPYQDVLIPRRTGNETSSSSCGSSCGSSSGSSCGGGCGGGCGGCGG